MSSSAQLPVYFPKGVADEAGQRGFVSKQEGGIDALDLSNGELLWSTDVASRPLIVNGEQLLAQSTMSEQENAFRVAALDAARDGSLLSMSEPLVFPDWVQVDETDESLFSIRARLREGELWLTWEAHSRYRGGAPPPQFILREATKDFVGTTIVNLRTGEVRMLSDVETTRAQEPSDSQLHPSLPYQMGFSQREAGWMVDDKIAALASVERGGQQSIILQTWDAQTGEANPSVELSSESGQTFYVTPEGLYIFLQSEEPEATGGEQRRWKIFSTQTGQPVAEWLVEASAQAACVLNDSKVYYLAAEASSDDAAHESQMLKARDLKTGELLWERQLEEPPDAMLRALRS